MLADVGIMRNAVRQEERNGLNIPNPSEQYLECRLYYALKY